MNYSPKLKKAMQQIKNILLAEDIAGIVVLHAPGHSEYLNHLYPRYSCIKIDTVADPKTGEMQQGIRIRALESELGKEKQKQMLNDTANMLVILNDVAGQIVMSNITIQEKFEEKFQIDKGPGNHSSETTQSN